jgi:hypothetical protein
MPPRTARTPAPQPADPGDSIGTTDPGTIAESTDPPVNTSPS